MAKFGNFGIAILVLFLAIIASKPSFATEPGSKACDQFGAANHCTAHWDRRDKACKC